MELTSTAWQTDLALRAWSGSEIEDRGDHLVVRTPTNPAYYWGNFILLPGRPGAGDVPGWLELFAQEFPRSRHLAFGVESRDGTLADLEPFREGGLTTEAAAVMTATTVHPPARPNTEATIRPLTSDEDWDQQVTLALTDEDLRGNREFATERSKGERRLVEDGHGTWFGAFLGGLLVSSLGVFVTPQGLARYQDVQTHPGFRGRGLCGTLVHRAGTHALEELGVETLVMVADPDYSAIRIYRAAGFTESETQLQAERRPG